MYASHSVSEEFVAPFNNRKKLRILAFASRTGPLARDEYDVALGNRFVKCCETAYIDVYTRNPNYKHGKWLLLDKSARDQLYKKWCRATKTLLRNFMSLTARDQARNLVAEWILHNKLFHSPEWLSVSDDLGMPFGGKTWCEDLSAVLPEFAEVLWVVRVSFPLQIHSLICLIQVAFSISPSVARWYKAAQKASSNSEARKALCCGAEGILAGLRVMKKSREADGDPEDLTRSVAPAISTAHFFPLITIVPQIIAAVLDGGRDAISAVKWTFQGNPLPTTDWLSQYIYRPPISKEGVRTVMRTLLHFSSVTNTPPEEAARLWCSRRVRTEAVYRLGLPDGNLVPLAYEDRRELVHRILAACCASFPTEITRIYRSPNRLQTATALAMWWLTSAFWAGSSSFNHCWTAPSMRGIAEEIEGVLVAFHRPADNDEDWTPGLYWQYRKIWPGRMPELQVRLSLYFYFQSKVSLILHSCSRETSNLCLTMSTGITRPSLMAILATYWPTATRWICWKQTRLNQNRPL